MYNGKPKEFVRTADGATAGSIELAGDGIISRGVLLDIPRLKGKDWLEPDEAVFPEDLDGAEKAAGLRVEAGDLLFVRLGWPLRRERHWPPDPTEGNCALQPACLPWLRERDVALLASDTSNDVSPMQYPGLGRFGGIHGVGMGALGLWILDNADFEALGETCARLGRWEFQAGDRAAQAQAHHRLPSQSAGVVLSGGMRKARAAAAGARPCTSQGQTQAILPTQRSPAWQHSRPQIAVFGGQ